VNRIDPLDILYQDLVAAVERAINEADPIDLLAGGAPSDEYAPEIGTIIPLLANAHRPDDVTAVLHGEFLRWCGEGPAGPRQAYEAPARQIWDALLEYGRAADTGRGSGSRAEDIELPQPTGKLVPTGDVPVHLSLLLFSVIHPFCQLENAITACRSSRRQAVV
jgi:hypothetical protein